MVEDRQLLKKWLKDAYPKSVICVDMNHNVWIQMDNSKYTHTVLCNIPENMYRVWLWDDWYYFTI